VSRIPGANARSSIGMSAPKPPVLPTVAAAYRDRGRVIHARPDVVGSTIVILTAFNLGGLFFLPSSTRDGFVSSDDWVMLAAAAVQSLLATAVWIAVNHGLNYCHSASPHLANCN